MSSAGRVWLAAAVKSAAETTVDTNVVVLIAEDFGCLEGAERLRITWPTLVPRSNVGLSAPERIPHRVRDGLIRSVAFRLVFG
jgi:hypothetical protein